MRTVEAHLQKLHVFQERAVVSKRQLDLNLRCLRLDRRLSCGRFGLSTGGARAIADSVQQPRRSKTQYQMRVHTHRVRLFKQQLLFITPDAGMQSQLLLQRHDTAGRTWLTWGRRTAKMVKQEGQGERGRGSLTQLQAFFSPSSGLQRGGQGSLPCRMVPGGCITSRGMNREPPAVVWRRCPCGRRIQIKPHIEPGVWMDSSKWDLGGGTFWLTPPPPLSLSLYERASITTQNHRIPLSPWDRVSNRRVGTLGVTSEGKT